MMKVVMVKSLFDVVVYGLLAMLQAVSSMGAHKQPCNALPHKTAQPHGTMVLLSC